ncbi:MAG TPA: response regulator [Candidatus Methanofastidiosa archaeon]|mgnify:CR=1 FL=1|nr:response regulator [Candidatus Methanofastidiosa archaeon]
MKDKLKLLHIEDDEDYVTIFQRKMREISRRENDAELVFETAGLTSIALSMVESKKYDCIVTDHQLGNEFGLEFLKSFRQNDILTPVIFVTGQGDEQVARDASLNGANDYFSKDISFFSFDKIYYSIIQHVNSSKDKMTLKLIQDFMSSINLSSTAGEIYGAIYDYFPKLFPCESLIVSSYDTEKKLIKADFAIHDGTIVDTAKMPILNLEADSGEGMQSTVLRTGEPLLIPDITEFTKKRCRQNYIIESNGTYTEFSGERDNENSQSMMIVPMKSHGVVVGAIQIQSKKSEAYDVHDLNILISLIRPLEVAIKHAYMSSENLDFLKELRSMLSQGPKEKDLKAVVDRIDERISMS